ncbi:pyrroline-5-carboxylate reductase [Shouchella shacheensis]|uniref:pyrroline-5-carboxylate reductase n=1 Tax=Shouchella shacheensis TaxID=1649580 RepID=UPI00073FD3BA|nr:pyrroline-5-carboxylate reductase [Shouchella shacheensis]
MFTKSIAFLGAGSMAEAIIGGLVRQHIVDPRLVTATNVMDTQRLEELEARYGIQTTSDRASAVAGKDIVILAMKPANVQEAIAFVEDVLTSEQLFISVAAGITLPYLEHILPANGAVIRSMPNTSAKVGASATALSLGTHATDTDLKTASALFQSIGSATVVAEAQMDAVTGIAGSGPAYFYYILEGLLQAAAMQGLAEEEAKAFVYQTARGVMQRLESTEKSPKQLYQEVMSPNGTTEAGIHHLEEAHLQAILQGAVAKAVKRSEEIGKELGKVDGVSQR